MPETKQPDLAPKTGTKDGKPAEAPGEFKPEPIELRAGADGSKNIELKKYFTFNETGNIMLATTIGESAEIQESVRKVFAEVSVFFAAMTKAITSTINPATGKPYSLYNYEAMRKIIAGFGCFIQVTELDVTHTSQSRGATFSKELIEALLGLATGSGAVGFASAMVSSVGKEGWRVSQSSSDNESEVGNIVFVCEYLLGMPNISAIVVHINAKDHKTEFQAGPCVKGSTTTQTFKMHKDTYMFVTPTFIHEYAGDLDSITTDAAYGKLVADLADKLK